MHKAAGGWIDSLRQTHDSETVTTYEIYAGVHWLSYFATVDEITRVSVAEYTRDRLSKVLRATVLKELSPQLLSST